MFLHSAQPKTRLQKLNVASRFPSSEGTAALMASLSRAGTAAFLTSNFRERLCRREGNQWQQKRQQ